MSFNVSPEDYGRFMGRYAAPLAVQFADMTDVQPGQRVLDVGCGPGALTSELVGRLGPGAVAAIDPSPPFVEAVRARFPDVDVRAGVAEHLPFPDAGFDLALAQLVVHFMTDPVAGLAEMARVTRVGGVVAASVWDHGGGNGPPSLFWRAVHDVDPDASEEAGLAGAQQGQLAELFRAAGLADVEDVPLTVTVAYDSFADWWEPFTLGVGPAGAYLARQDEPQRELVRARCAELLPAGQIHIRATAWSAMARVGRTPPR